MPYDIYDYEALYFTVGFFFILLIFTILIELGVLYIYFRKYIIEGKCSLKFIKSVIVVNLFTFPMTQLISLLLSMLSIQIFLLLIITEIAPISIEYVLYLKIFNEFHASNNFFIPISKKKVTSSTLTANLITFSLGIFIFLPQIILTAFK
ncbi:MAG: hypothetical protein ACFE8B_15625 [Candidatus Hermodarchaeota archaeon]